MRGRKPRPLQAQINEGDPRQRGKRKLEAKLAAEPKAARGLPLCPTHLRGRARAAWNFWREELAHMSLDRRPDAMMLEGACVNYARAVKADLILEEDGLIVEESVIDPESGEKTILKRKNHPAVAISRTCWIQTRSFCGEFGLSPVSRTRLTMEVKDDGEDDLMKALAQPRAPRTPVSVN